MLYIYADIAGKDWACCCCPGGCACFEKKAINEDEIIHHGLLCLFFGIPCGFTEKRIRLKNTNSFYKEGEPKNLDVYTSSSSVCNGISCSTKHGLCCKKKRYDY